MAKSLRVEVKYLKERIKFLAFRHSYDVSHDLRIINELEARIDELENLLKKVGAKCDI